MHTHIHTQVCTHTHTHTPACARLLDSMPDVFSSKRLGKNKVLKNWNGFKTHLTWENGGSGKGQQSERFCLQKPMMKMI